MHDTVTADGRGFDQDSGRARNANVPTGRTTAITTWATEVCSVAETKILALLCKTA